MRRIRIKVSERALWGWGNRGAYYSVTGRVLNRPLRCVKEGRVEDDKTLATKTVRFELAVYQDENGSNIFMPGVNRVCVEITGDMRRILALLEAVRERRKVRVEVKLFRENMWVGAIGLATLILGL